MQLSAIPRLSIEPRLNFERQAGRGKIRESVVTPARKIYRNAHFGFSSRVNSTQVIRVNDKVDGKFYLFVFPPSHCNQYAAGFKIWFGVNRPDYTHWDYCVGYF